MKEENNFDSVSDFNVEVNNALPPPSEANIILENNIELETYAFVSQQESEDLDDCWGLTSFYAPDSLVEGIQCDENEADINSTDSG